MITGFCILHCTSRFVNFVCSPGCDKLEVTPDIFDQVHRPWPVTPVVLGPRGCIFVWKYELNMSIDTVTQLSGRCVLDLDAVMVSQMFSDNKAKQFFPETKGAFMLYVVHNYYSCQLHHQQIPANQA